MAATDQPYRSQRALDIVFAVSGVLMLLSVIIMFAQDYFRDYKHEQRIFRDVEAAVAQRTALQNLPNPEDITKAESAVEEARKTVAERSDEIKKTERELSDAQLARVKAEARYQAVKADYDSLVSLYNIDVENLGQDSPHTKAMKAKVEELGAQMGDRQRDYQNAQRTATQLEKKLAEFRKPLTDAVTTLTKLNADFDRIVKNAEQKRWKWYNEGVRNLPILDAFKAPTPIEQFTLDDLPIDYSFKRVTRYDRCMTCHKGIDSPSYSRQTLASLDNVTEEQADKLQKARDMIKSRRQLLAGTKDELPYTENSLQLTTIALKKGGNTHDPDRVTEFCAHPRLDLFVDDNSPHPKDKFGCTVCHSGQGSGTTFFNSSHTPNDAGQADRWTDLYGWKNNHYWDFPMLARRFTESSCLKCHYDTTQLIREGNKVEAPKLIEGYNLLRRAGCFGCHEISGIKGGRWVGPDLRLEPTPPLDSLSPAEQAKILADPLSPPGSMRKVGPSLRRISEKTHEDWVRKWIKAPRDFRPDTWMPHFYGLSNNREEALAGTGQEKFPDTEITAITWYLFQKSQAFLDGKHPTRVADQERLASLEALQKDNQATDKQKQEIIEIRDRLERSKPPIPLAKEIRDEHGRIVQLPAPAKDDKERQERATRGRQLFTERGCLACHQHQGTTTAAGSVAAVVSKADFGPDLSRVAAKLGVKAGDTESARRWLVQWIVNPTMHSPRTLMPITHMDPDQADAIATWLLSQQAPWQGPVVAEPDLETLKKMARLYLDKVTTRSQVDAILDPKGDADQETQKEFLKGIRAEADESELKSGITAENLKSYVGRKAISNLGCYACHEIPGFESAKPIGTPLNDWGKKDAERLAFEDIQAFIDKNYHTVEALTDEEGKPVQFKEGKAPYEKFFKELIDHHLREGFLYQKLREPRSYDYARLRNWDERLRMPQFRFSRPERKADENDDAFKARAEKEEAEAREKVMTFILGLVAEPIPAKYVHTPKGDRAAEIKGRLVLDKFNCGGCHLIREGLYEFKKSPTVIEKLEEVAAAGRDSATAKSDHVFPNHNAWFGVPSTQPDRIAAHAVVMPESNENQTLLRLTDALRFTTSKNQVQDIPAATTLGIGDGLIPTADILRSTPAYGGTFAEILAPYLRQKDATVYPDYKTQRASAPPPLLREGEKAQPGWLFQFLRNPQPIRPLVVLRMPKFNMTDDEAMALVNYFAAVDKVSNPGVSVNYPYVAVPQRENDFWETKAREYVASMGEQKAQERLKAMQPTWEQILKEEIAQKERLVRVSEDAVKTAKVENDKKENQRVLDIARKSLDESKARLEKKDFKALDQQYLTRDAYAADAWRLLTNYNNPCLGCHQVGPVAAKQQQGPPLELAFERLRPEWTLRWIASPERMISYPTPMPYNFPANNPPYPEMHGSPRQQAEAVRDILLNLPKVADMPVNRYSR